MSSNAEKLYKLIANDSKKKQSLFMTALTNPKKALDKICDIGNELNISVTKEEVIEYLSTIDDEATKMWLIKGLISFFPSGNRRWKFNFIPQNIF